jgi:HPt (histidine-containing phosphotransfer) domain-containing protein
MAQELSGKEVFNRAEMLERLMDDEELLEEVVRGFLEDAPLRIAALKEALGEGDAALVRREAHTLKGAASNISAGALCQAASETEKAGVAEELDKAASLTAEIDEQFEILKKAVARSGLLVSAT